MNPRFQKKNRTIYSGFQLRTKLKRKLRTNYRLLNATWWKLTTKLRPNQTILNVTRLYNTKSSVTFMTGVY